MEIFSQEQVAIATRLAFANSERGVNAISTYEVNTRLP